MTINDLINLVSITCNLKIYRHVYGHYSDSPDTFCINNECIFEGTVSDLIEPNYTDFELEFDNVKQRDKIRIIREKIRYSPICSIDINTGSIIIFDPAKELKHE